MNRFNDVVRSSMMKGTSSWRPDLLEVKARPRLVAMNSSSTEPSITNRMTYDPVDWDFLSTTAISASLFAGDLSLLDIRHEFDKTHTILKYYPSVNVDYSTAPAKPFSNEANAFLNQLYIESGSEKSDAVVLSIAFEKIEKALADGNVLFVNELLAEIRASRLRQVVLIGILRATFRVRSRLSSWNACVTNTWDFLETHDKNPKHLLRGLHSTNDPTTFATAATIL